MSGVQVRALSLPQQRNCRAQQQVGAKALRVTMHMQPGAAIWPFVPAMWDIWELSPVPPQLFLCCLSRPRPFSGVFARSLVATLSPSLLTFSWSS